MRSTLALMTFAAGLALPAGVAAASTVAVPVPGGPAVFVSNAPASDVTSQLVAFTSLQFKDAGQALTAGAGCVAGPPVSCAAVQQDLHFGNFDDRFRGFSNADITIAAGGGQDIIRTAGDLNTVNAGAGNDKVWENGNTPGPVNGDAGNDELYSFEAQAIVHGGIGNDLLVTHSNLLNNQLAGGADDDQLVVTSAGNGTLAGDAGNDTIVLDTPLGGFTADGGAGADTIKGSPGKDKVFGGPGDDVIDVTGGGTADTVDCGDGIDLVYTDANDVLAHNCEKRATGVSPVLPKVKAAVLHANAFVAAMPAIPPF